MAKKNILISVMLMLSAISMYSQNLVISGSNSHSVMICANGEIYAWGKNNLGQLGVDENGNAYSVTSSSDPLRIGAIGEIFQVDAGSGAHTLAMTCFGKVYAWGLNTHGQLGNTTITNLSNGVDKYFPTPTLVQAGETNPTNPSADLENVIFVSGGNTTSMAIWEGNGSTFAITWGENAHQEAQPTAGDGNLYYIAGDGSTDATKPRPVFVRNGERAGNPPLEDVIAIEAGDATAIALTGDGGFVWSWGSNQNKALGRPGSTDHTRAMRVRTATGYLQNIVSITAGDRHMLALDANGNVWSWGGNWGQGQLGDGETYDRFEYATKVLAGQSGAPGEYLGDNDPVVSIAAGQAHSIASTASGAVYTWGTNGFYNTSGAIPLAGQLGIGSNYTFQDAATGSTAGGVNTMPARGLLGAGRPLTDIVAVSDGDAWTFAVDASGEIYMAGWNKEGELGLGNNTNRTYFTLMTNKPCQLNVPCPEINLGPDLLECDNFSFDLQAGLINPGFRVNYYYDGALIYEDSVKLSEEARKLKYTVRKFGTYKVEIEDRRPVTRRPCFACDLVFDEITISEYQAPFEDPGKLNAANKLTFCGLINDAYVEKMPWNTYDGKYQWYGTNTPSKPNYNQILATSIDEEIIDTPLDTLNLERHEDYDKNDPNSNDSVFYAYVEDISSFLANAGEGSVSSFCTRESGYNDSKQYVLVTVYTSAILSELSFMQLDLYNSTSADFSVAVYKYNAADPNGTNLRNPINAPLTKSTFNAIMGTPIQRTIQGLNIELEGSASGEQYWIGVESSAQQVVRYTCNGNYPYQDDNADYSVFTINKKNGSNEENRMSAITNIGLQVGSQYPCDRIKVAITRRCPPCTKPQILGLQFETGEDEIICPGQSVTIKPNVTTANLDQENIAWRYYSSAIADTSLANRVGDEVPGAWDSLNLRKAQLEVHYSGGSSFYTLFLYDNHNPDDVSCWEARQIEVIAPEPPKYEFGEPAEICSGENATDITLMLTGEAPFSFTVKDQNDISYTTELVDPSVGNVFKISPLPTDVGSYDFRLTELSDATCYGEVQSTVNTNLTVHAVPDITLPKPEDVCVYASAFDASTGLSVAPAGISGTGVFSSNATGAISSSGVFSPQKAGDGTWTITYTYTTDAASGSCQADTSVEVVVHEKPNVYFDLLDEICGYADPVTLTGEQYSNTTAKTEVWKIAPQTGGMPDVSGGIFDPKESGAQTTTYTITYEYESTAGCMDTAKMDITVHQIEPPVTTGDPSINIQSIDELLEMVAIGEKGATFTWYYDGNQVFQDVNNANGISEYKAEAFSGTADSIGEYDYVVTQTLNGCTSDGSDVTTIITDCPTPAPPVGNTFMCIAGDDIPQFVATAAGHGDLIWTNSAGTIVKQGLETTYTPAVDRFTAAVHEYYVYEHNDERDCDGPASRVTLTVRDTPNVTISLADVDYCWYDGQVTFDVQPRKKDSDDIESIFGEGTGLTSSGATFNPGVNSTVSDTYRVLYEYTEVRADQNGLSCKGANYIDINVLYVPPVQPINDYKLNTSPTLEIGADDYTGNLIWEKNDVEIPEAEGLDIWNPTQKYVPRPDGLWELGVHRFAVKQEIDGCFSDTTGVVVQIIDCPTKAPVPENLAYCVDETTAPSVRAAAFEGIDANLHWFASPSDIAPGNTRLGDGPSFTPDDIETRLTDVGEHSFYVSEWDPAEQCYGPSTKVVLTVHQPVDVSVSIQPEICHGTNASIITDPQLGSTGSLTSNASGAVVGNQFRTSNLPEVEHATYTIDYLYNHTYASTGKECEYSASTTTDVIFVNPPITTGAYHQQDTPVYTPAPSVFARIAGADCIEWTSLVGTPLNDLDCDTVYKSPELEEGIYTYYAIRRIGECRSVPAPVQLQISYCPVGGVLVENDIVCDNVTSYSFAAAPDFSGENGEIPDGNETIYWFTEPKASLNKYEGQGEDLTVSVAGKNLVTRYASLYDPDYGCFGKISRVELNVAHVNPPQLNPVIPICEFDGTGVTLSAQQTLSALNEGPSASVRWYRDAALTDMFFEGYSTVAPDRDNAVYSYYATLTKIFSIANGNSATCTSAPRQMQYTIYDNPNKPLVENGLACQESGQTLQLRAVSSYDVHWYEAFTNKEMATTNTNLPLSESRLVVGDNHFFAKAYDMATQCWSDSAVAVFTLKEKPRAPLISSDIKAICDGLDEIEPITALSQIGTVVRWYIGGSDVVRAEGDVLKLDKSEVSPGYIHIKVVADLDGCESNPTIDSLPVKEVPDASFDMDTIVCQNKREQVVIKPRYPDQKDVDFYIEDLRVGLNPVTNTGTDYPIFVYKADNAGKDTVVMTVTNGYCSDTNVQPFFVVPPPKVDLEDELYFGTGTAVFQNYTIQDSILELGAPAIEYWMTFSEDIFDTVYPDKFPYSRLYEYGEYTATLFALDSFGCIGMDTVNFKMEIETGLYMPSAFAPNVPANKEVKYFLPKGFNLKEYHLYVYDAWGNMVFYTDRLNEKGSPVEPWTGKDMEGNLLQPGYYIWKVDATFKNFKKWDGVKDKNGKYRTFGNIHFID